MVYCSKCGHTMTEQEWFCPQCGSQVTPPAPPSPVPYVPPVHRVAPTSSLTRDLKTCVVGLVVSVLCLVLSILQLTVPDFENEWVRLLSKLLFGGAIASYVFAAVHCKPAVAFLATIPYIADWTIYLIHTLVEYFDYYEDELLQLFIYYFTSMAVPVVTVLIVSVLRKRRPPEMVQSTAILVAFGLRMLIDAVDLILYEVIPQIQHGYFDMHSVLSLYSTLYFWEVVGFAAVFLVSWLLLKNRKSRLRH